MHLLIAYDGTPGARAALRDLARAGLPAAASAEVLAVATAGRNPAARALLLDEAKMLAAAGAEHLRAQFPGWKVSAHAAEGAAHTAIVARAEEVGADLVVVGTRGLTHDEKAALGSVARGVTTNSTRSVRVARGSGARSEGAPRILVGFDGSRGADEAVAEVCRRTWPAGTAVRLLACTPDGAQSPGAAGAPGAVDAARARLAAAGLEADAVTRTGEPAARILEEASAWGAAVIFLGGRRLQRLRRFLFGSVAGSVADDAPCSVEVVRAPADEAAAGDSGRGSAEKPSHGRRGAASS